MAGDEIAAPGPFLLLLGFGGASLGFDCGAAVGGPAVTADVAHVDRLLIRV
jgi:hypothetical protein